MQAKHPLHSYLLRGKKNQYLLRVKNIKNLSNRLNYLEEKSSFFISIFWCSFSVRFGFYKKNNQIDFKKTETEPKPIQTNRLRFGFLEQKPVQISLARFFWFFLFGFGLVWFGSVFSVPGLKNWNQTELISFFKILISLIRFFHGSIFLVIFF